MWIGVAVLKGRVRVLSAVSPVALIVEVEQFRLERGLEGRLDEGEQGRELRHLGGVEVADARDMSPAGEDHIAQAALIGMEDAASFTQL